MDRECLFVSGVVCYTWIVSPNAGSRFEKGTLSYFVLNSRDRDSDIYMDLSRSDANGRTAFYENQRAQETAAKTIDFPKVAKPPFTLSESFANSPRRTHLAKAGGDTLPYGEQMLLQLDRSPRGLVFR